MPRSVRGKEPPPKHGTAQRPPGCRYGPPLVSTRTVSPAATVGKGGPVCAASSSGCSGGPVPLVCAAEWLGLASGEPASHGRRVQVRKQKRSRSCEGERSARTQCGQHERRLHDTPAVCAAVSPCGGVLVSSRPSSVGSGGAGAPAVGTRCTHSGVLYILAYCEYSRTPKGTVSGRTCSVRRGARVIQSLDRRRRWCRRTCGGVLGELPRVL
jgi:hypothetical protein